MLQKFGLGIDIVKVERFKNKPYSKNKIFYKKIFLDSEIKYCLKHKNSAIHFSGKLIFNINKAGASNNRKNVYQITDPGSGFIHLNLIS